MAIAETRTTNPRKRVRGKKVIVILIFLLMVAIALGLGWFFLLPGNKNLDIFKMISGSNESENINVSFVDMEEMVVVLRSQSSQRQKFLKVSITLELENPADRVLVNELKPLIIDSYQFFLRELRLDELQGSSGLYAVKEELLARTNLIVNPAKVRDVLFRDFLIQ